MTSSHADTASLLRSWPPQPEEHEVIRLDCPLHGTSHEVGFVGRRIAFDALFLEGFASTVLAATCATCTEWRTACSQMRGALSDSSLAHASDVLHEAARHVAGARTLQEALVAAGTETLSVPRSAMGAEDGFPCVLRCADHGVESVGELIGLSMEAAVVVRDFGAVQLLRGSRTCDDFQVARDVLCWDLATAWEAYETDEWQCDPLSVVRFYCRRRCRYRTDRL